MENQNNNLINKAKEEIESAKNVISNMNDKNKTIPEKVKSVVTPKNSAENFSGSSEINEKANAVSNNSSDTGNSGKHAEFADNKDVSNSFYSSNNSSDISADLANSSNSNTQGNSENENSNDENSEVEILDELSKACQLAMSNISFLATKSISKDIKAALVSIYSGYTDILSSINQNFAQIGEIPSNVSPNLKMVGLCSINLNTKVDKSVSHIAEIMIQGLNMGIIKCQKLLNSSNSSSIRKETLDLIQRFLDFQESSIQKLKMYL